VYISAVFFHNQCDAAAFPATAFIVAYRTSDGTYIHHCVYRPAVVFILLSVSSSVLGEKCWS